MEPFTLTDEHPFPPTYSCTTATPWGRAQDAAKYGLGVISYSCAGHGGFHLSPSRNAQVHEAWRDSTGWYEEDCEWAIVALTFPELFAPKHVQYARESAKNWFPDAYTIVTGHEVTLDESFVLRDRKFASDHADDWVVTSAYGSWADWVPAGKVGVYASIGGDRSSGGDSRWLIDESRYEARQGSYVIDPAVDERLGEEGE